MVKDKMMEIYELLKADKYIQLECFDRIKFYEYPETADTSKPFIIIEPLEIISPSTHGSNKELNITFSYQIDVQGSKRMTVKNIQAKIKDIMVCNGFSQLPYGMDEYFKETKRYVDARRYVGNSKLYDTNY